MHNLKTKRDISTFFSYCTKHKREFSIRTVGARTLKFD